MGFHALFRRYGRLGGLGLPRAHWPCKDGRGASERSRVGGGGRPVLLGRVDCARPSLFSSAAVLHESALLGTAGTRTPRCSGQSCSPLHSTSCVVNLVLERMFFGTQMEIPWFQQERRVIAVSPASGEYLKILVDTRDWRECSTDIFLRCLPRFVPLWLVCENTGFRLFFKLSGARS